MPISLRTASWCATQMTVRPARMGLRFRATSTIVWWSSAELNSSRSTIRGSATKSRAKATLCFSPPESCAPCSPTSVRRPWGSLAISGPRPAWSKAASICSSVAATQPSRTLSTMVPEIKVGSCGTTPTRPPRRSLGSTSRTSTPPTVTQPPSTSYRRETRRRIVDLPLPDKPRMATRSPADTSSENFESVGASRVG
mmetsp:Transcript_16501/g.55700  ORF Transcript_16501/g.55700 Transcript_16501/m.55700 type:complete len:197 (-) Transcript_16501:917-1507(-)